MSRAMEKLHKEAGIKEIESLKDEIEHLHSIIYDLEQRLDSATKNTLPVTLPSAPLPPPLSYDVVERREIAVQTMRIASTVGVQTTPFTRAMTTQTERNTISIGIQSSILSNNDSSCQCDILAVPKKSDAVCSTEMIMTDRSTSPIPSLARDYSYSQISDRGRANVDSNASRYSSVDVSTRQHTSREIELPPPPKAMNAHDYIKQYRAAWEAAASKHRSSEPPIVLPRRRPVDNYDPPLMVDSDDERESSPEISVSASLSSQRERCEKALKSLESLLSDDDT